MICAMADLKVTVRVPPDLVEALDAKLGDGQTRTSAVRDIVVEALSGTGRRRKPKPMTHGDIRAKLEARARGGSSPAMKALLALNRQDEVDALMRRDQDVERAYLRGEIDEIQANAPI